MPLYCSMPTKYKRKSVNRGLWTEQNVSKAFKAIDKGMDVNRTLKHYTLLRP